MRKRLGVAAATLLALVVSMVVFTLPAHAAAGFQVSGGRLLDANGNDFVMRGINHAHTWYPTQTGSFADIKATGANTVRVVLASGQRWTRNEASDVANVISLCKANRLICVLEVHDTTGYGEQAGAATLAQAVDYWISVQSALTGQERYVILNIGNEPYGNQNYQSWAADTSTAIQRLRTAGFDHTIMVDAPNWGQDWTFTMRDNASTVFNADPDRNTMFSVHMYGVFDTAAEVTDYLGRFISAGLPIVVGEFGDMHSDGNPDEDAIMATAQARRIGYLGWSWSGNGGGVEYLDIVTNFNPASLSPWGQRLINGANGIRATSVEASVYGGGGSSPTPTRTTGPTPTGSPSPTGGSSGCTATYAVSGQWSGGFQGDVRVTATGAITGWRVTWTYGAGQTVTNAWNATITSSGAAVTATNVSHNGRLAAGGSTSFGFLGSWTGGNPVPAVTCTAS
ncbi:cellulase family glycosylhydrolase [Catenuloplanes atrovinosus]|uniref:Endoglucanase n=1 Tax=Catenuloplanes atrovinosus TaxID=137266 RepID=A0AAE4CGD1_9ACTN|nr:cellulase family glycosylhydrolase [Catenuloplanes atrovinosus]MDR7280575.1 mannan endo-1,4-beta-mannosidase [Catenuloplanes atrovinosus]